MSEKNMACYFTTRLVKRSQNTHGKLARLDFLAPLLCSKTSKTHALFRRAHAILQLLEML
jgi:hypothetical protein